MTVAVLLTALACGVASAALLEALAASQQRTTPRGGRRPRSSPPPQARWTRTRSVDRRADALLDAAGRRGGVPDVAALRVRERTAALLAAAWCGAVVFAVAGPLMAAASLPLGAALGRGIPAMLLRRAAAARAGVLRDQAPEVVALLAAGASCGMPLGAVLASAGEWLDGELAEAFEHGARDLGRGASPERVLARLAREQPIDEVGSLVAVLVRAREHGVASAPALKALASAARSARARRAADRAARAAPRIQLVAALLLVPASLCMLAAAMLSGGLR